MSKPAKSRPWSWDRHQWGQPTTDAVVARRAGGRRRRNAEQQLAKAVRRYRVERRIVETWPALMTDRGWQVATAHAFGVDRATICRDVDGILGGLGISYRLLRALMWTPRERKALHRVGITLPDPV